MQSNLFHLSLATTEAVKSKWPSKTGQSGRFRKPKPLEVEPTSKILRTRQTNGQRQSAKQMNEKHLQSMLAEKLKQQSICLSSSGHMMVTIPEDVSLCSSCPGTSCDPLDLGTTSPVVNPEPEIANDAERFPVPISIKEETLNTLNSDRGDGSDTETEGSIEEAESTCGTNSSFPVPAENDKSSSAQGDNANEAQYWKTRYQSQAAMVKRLSKQLLEHRVKLAQLKDLVAFQMSEIRDLKMGKQSSAFTIESGIDITIEQIESIHLESKTTAIFAQKLAMFFMGQMNYADVE
ncbi:uncharacterized protein LOC131693963 isoform X1 [Topomyia yanbarensis]|uniref:uncharacterized protein LOC131693963 isoform X1 n=1 Tax=Topomyia yanbarensis TaxID=2498891 RepID=UPI00273BFE5E|nr:uncharacterized protein LOC131693963 isoform X1 [Topomyia yanbarensis]